ncbi:MAG: chorismate mutase [Candidatus Bathyarchaeota archaeon]|jgi:chorismate mutase|nr:chorismate mutase [Candidatus Bathyarchaeota archaeon]
MTYEEEIAPHRAEINRLNKEILERLAERVEVAEAIAEVKRRHGKPIVDAARERIVLDQARVQAQARGLDPDGAERVFRAIIDLCVEAEEHP